MATIKSSPLDNAALGAGSNTQILPFDGAQTFLLTQDPNPSVVDLHSQEADALPGIDPNRMSQIRDISGRLGNLALKVGAGGGIGATASLLPMIDLTLAQGSRMGGGAAAISVLMENIRKIRQ